MDNPFFIKFKKNLEEVWLLTMENLTLFKDVMEF